MLGKFRRKISSFCEKIRYIPGCYILTSIILLSAALVIRLATGGTHIVYNVLDGRGIFPGPFWYMVLYCVRLVMCGSVLSFSLFSRRIYEERFVSSLFAVVATVLLLLEYRLIFGGVSLILAIVFSLTVPLCCIISAFSVRFRSRPVLVILLLFVILQIVFFVQLISLTICI